jgi:hypothetical protein
MFIITGFKDDKKKYQSTVGKSHYKHALRIAHKYEKNCSYAIIMDDETANAVYITNDKNYCEIK